MGGLVRGSGWRGADETVTSMRFCDVDSQSAMDLGGVRIDRRWAAYLLSSRRIPSARDRAAFAFKSGSLNATIVHHL